MTGRAAIHDDGFTLVELLVSLVILALMLAMLPATLQFGRGAASANEEMLEAAETTAVRHYLEARVGEAMPVFGRDAAGRSAVAFEGHADSVRFVAVAANGKQGPGLYRHVISLAADGPGATPALMFRQWPYRPREAETPPELIFSRILLADARRVTFRYFGSTEPGRPRAWQSDWTRGDALPELIEITLPRRGRGAGPAIPLVITMRMGVAR